jgi:hypothetical protein
MNNLRLCHKASKIKREPIRLNLINTFFLNGKHNSALWAREPIQYQPGKYLGARQPL